jgi:Tfp pilus assembly protein PilX
MTVSNRTPEARQHGAATLLVVTVLAMAMTVISLTTARTGLMEQKLVGNDLRAREAQEAAEAGLEYGMAWADKNQVPWNGGTIVNCPGTGCPPLPSVTGSTTGETYGINSLVYSRSSSTSDRIHVTSIAAGVADSTVTAKAEAYVEAIKILTPAGKKPPPVALDGCMTSTTGTPDIYPNWNDLDGDGVQDPNEWNDENGNGSVDTGEWTDNNGNNAVDNEMGRSMATSQPEYVAGNFCLDYCGHGSGCDPTATETGHSHLDLHNGVLQNNLAFPNNSIWDYYFSVSQTQFQAAASTTLSTAGGLYWITATGNWPNGSYGSVTDPVIIVFVNDCPKPSGSTTIHGILFFLERDGCVTNPMNGWGSVTVYGSVAANGGIDKMNANLAIHGVGNGGTMPAVNSALIAAPRIPGTWKDF